MLFRSCSNVVETLLRCYSYMSRLMILIGILVVLSLFGILFRISLCYLSEKNSPTYEACYRELERIAEQEKDMIAQHEEVCNLRSHSDHTIRQLPIQTVPQQTHFFHGIIPA